MIKGLDRAELISKVDREDIIFLCFLEYIDYEYDEEDKEISFSERDIKNAGSILKNVRNGLAEDIVEKEDEKTKKSNLKKKIALYENLSLNRIYDYDGKIKGIVTKGFYKNYKQWVKSLGTGKVFAADIRDILVTDFFVTTEVAERMVSSFLYVLWSHFLLYRQLIIPGGLRLKIYQKDMFKQEADPNVDVSFFGLAREVLNPRKPETYYNFIDIFLEKLKEQMNLQSSITLTKNDFRNFAEKFIKDEAPERGTSEKKD